MHLEQISEYLRGRQVFFIKMETDSGMAAVISSLGASLTRLLVPSSETGRRESVVLSLADPAGYAENPFYAGAVLGPNAGRIRNARLTLPESLQTGLPENSQEGFPASSQEGFQRIFPLTTNDGLHNLHGGRSPVSFADWNIVETGTENGCARLVLETVLSDGQDGFPGNRRIRASYTLSEEGVLSLHFWAVTDRPTYLNLSHHGYWNLSGDFSRSACDQHLSIAASRYIANDTEHLPAEICPVSHSPFDFRTSVSLRQRQSSCADHPQLKNANGYNNGFLLQTPDGAPAAALSDPQSGRTLRLFTDAPCLVLYSGGYLAGGPAVLGKEGTAIPASNGCALALEAQDYPDAPGNPLYPPCRYLLPGEIWTREIRWEIGW